MAISDKTLPYEILIRFGEDGAPRGAHVQRQRIVTRDGEVLKHEVLPPESLGLSDFPASALMTDATSAAIQKAAALADSNDDLTKQLADQQRNFTEFQQSHVMQMDIANGQIDQLKASLKDAAVQIAALEKAASGAG